jgi:putative ABC transport system substrate-binding protein
MISRRSVLSGLLTGLAVPRFAESQQTRIHKIGVLTLVSSAPHEEVFRQSLRERGYIEGKTITFEWKSAEGQRERLAALAAALVASRVDVIVTVSNDAVQAAKEATTSIPIVMAASGDPERRGLVASLAKPGGNVTGLTLDPGAEIVGKMLELLKQAAPKVSRVAMLAVPGAQIWAAQADAAAPKLGMQLEVFTIDDPTRLSDVLGAIARSNPDAVLVTSSALTFGLRRPIVEFATKGRLPGIYPYRPYAEDGGLIAYGVDLKDLFRRTAGYVDRILKGAKPANLPVEQPTKFELLINLKTARALGLTIPPPLLLRADEVIE